MKKTFLALALCSFIGTVSGASINLENSGGRDSCTLDSLRYDASRNHFTGNCRGGSVPVPPPPVVVPPPAPLPSSSGLALCDALPETRGGAPVMATLTSKDASGFGRDSQYNDLKGNAQGFSSVRVYAYHWSIPTPNVAGALMPVGGNSSSVIQYFTLSTVPCDFRLVSEGGTALFTQYSPGGGTVPVKVTGREKQFTYFDPAEVLPNKTYYLNIRSWHPGENRTACASGMYCGSVIDFVGGY